MSGLLAGLILEKGLASGMYPAMGVRLVADLLLAAVMPLFTIFIPMPNQGLSPEKSRFTGGRYLPAKNKDARQISNNKFDR
ncbi:hypothetical protein ACLMAB_23315 [Brevibacillus laterosporus]